MGWLDALLGRPSEEDLARAVGAAVEAVPGVLGHDASYHHQPNGGGAITGLVDVLDARVFGDVLRAAVLAAGARGRRSVVYLAARTPDDRLVEPESLGLSPRPSGAQVLARLGGDVKS